MIRSVGGHLAVFSIGRYFHTLDFYRIQWRTWPNCRTASSFCCHDLIWHAESKILICWKGQVKTGSRKWSVTETKIQICFDLSQRKIKNASHEPNHNFWRTNVTDTGELFLRLSAKSIVHKKRKVYKKSHRSRHGNPRRISERLNKISTNLTKKKIQSQKKYGWQWTIHPIYNEIRRVSILWRKQAINWQAQLISTHSHHLEASFRFPKSVSIFKQELNIVGVQDNVWWSERMLTCITRRSL